jgi:hypothetical protein
MGEKQDIEKVKKEEKRLLDLFDIKDSNYPICRENAKKCKNVNLCVLSMPDPKIGINFSRFNFKHKKNKLWIGNFLLTQKKLLC